MKKLKHILSWDISDDIKSKYNEDVDIPYEHDKFTVEFYLCEDLCDDEWESYRVKFVELDDYYDLRIAVYAMDISREIEKRDGGTIVEFIYHVLMDLINEEDKEIAMRDFLDEISD